MGSVAEAPSLLVSRATTLICVLGAAVAYALLFPPWSLAPLAFVAVAPLAYVLRDACFWRAARSAYLFGLVMTALIVAWLVPTAHHYYGISPWGAIGFLLVVSALAVAPQLGLIAGLLAWRRAPAAAWPFLFAFGWVAAEWLRTETGIRSPWTRLGDAAVEWERLRQIADVAGVYGLSFLLALGNALVAEAVASWRLVAGRAERLRANAPALASFVVLLVASLGYGEAQRARYAAETPELDVLMVQGSVPQSIRWRRARASQVLRRYVRLTREALDEGEGAPPDLIVWPENAMQTSPSDPVYGPPLRRVAEQVGRPLLVGAPRTESAGEVVHHYNSAHLIDADGRVAHYDKRRLLLFSETGLVPDAGPGEGGGHGRYAAGDRPGHFRVSDRGVSTLICLEALYPGLAREAARAGAALIVNLANDGWFRGVGGREQHLALVRFRAIETRRPVLRSTTSGVSASIGPDGAVDARLDGPEAGWLRTTVRRGAASPTIYARAGDVLPILGLTLCVLAARPAPLRLREPRSASGSAGDSPMLPT